MTRSELDGARWAIPGARTKNKRPHAIALPPLALDVIAGVKAIYGDAGYVFSTSGTRPISGFSKVKSRLDAAMLDLARREAADRGLDPAQIKIQDWRLHDLRRTAATGMQRAGADVHVIERTLNHFSGTFGGIVSTYQQHKFETEVRAAVEAWSKLLLSIVGELPPNVVPIRA